MLFTEDASYYAKQVKTGETTVQQLVQRALENIQKTNNKINAVTHIHENYAYDLAEKYDNHLETLSAAEKEKLPVFFGVPTLLKEAGQTIEGLPADNAARIMEGNIARQTNHFAQTVLDAGFVVVGRSNAPEFSFKNISDSDLHGPVSTPFAKNRYPGGSSGGAASALKAGVVPFATASDGGGSIRIPASFSGLIGLKPSRGRTAVGPDVYRGWQGASIDFALTRSVRDTWEALKALQVEDFSAPFIIPKIEENELTDLDRPLRIAVIEESPTKTEITSSTKEMMEKSKNILESLGHTLVSAEPEIDGVKALMSYYIVNGGETAVMIENIEKSLKRPVKMRELDPFTWAVNMLGKSIPASEYSRVLTYWDQISDTLGQFFEDFDVILQPTTNGPGIEFDTTVDQKEMFYKKFENMEDLEFEERLQLVYDSFNPGSSHTPFSQQQNLAGSPAISLPLYETAEGLPVGTQLWGHKGNDYLLLQLTKQIEEEGYLKTEIFDPENQQ